VPVGDPLATDAWLVLVTAGLTNDALALHTHEIEEVTGLREELDALGAAIEALEDLVPTGGVEGAGSIAANATVAEWTLLPIAEIFPARLPITVGNSLAEIDRTKLPRERGLFGAVHDAVVEALPDPLPNPAAEYAGRVFENQTGNDVTLKGGAGMRSVVIADGAFAACDGRAWYEVEQYGTDADDNKTSFYPAAFKRSLFELHIDAKQLRLKRTLTLNFGFEACVMNSDTRAQWAVMLEFGTAEQASTPATTGPNLSAITWAAPVLDHRIILTNQPQKRMFGLTVSRALVAAVDTLTATTLVDGLEESCDAPASATFAIRGTLCRFDTEDGLTDPRGYVALRGLNVAVGETETGFAEIK
jgi:hypothetical protein